MIGIQRLAPADPPSTGDSGAAAMPARPGDAGARVATVLVVEDEFLVRMSVADFLRDSGYRVLEAATAGEAQASFQAGEPIDLVFTDVTMPGGMDGRALAAWIHREYPDVHIILTSGATAIDPRETGGAVLFLRKPYGFDDLVAAIRKLMPA